MRRDTCWCWLGQTLLSALGIAGCTMSLLACDAAQHASVDAAAAEAGASAEPEDGGGEQSDASEVRDAQVALDASDAEVAARDAGAGEPGASSLSFAKPSAATWEGTGEWRVELKLAEAAPRATRLELTTGGSAESGTDFKLATSVEFAAGNTVAQISITIVDDKEREPSETLTLSVGAASHTLTIADDDDDRWPTSDAVSEVDAARAFAGANLSGLAYLPARSGAPSDLWMVRNGPSQLYKLRASGAQWSAVSSDGWAQGKTLVFPDGSGAPDAEGLTLADLGSPWLYAVSERDGIGPSAPTVLAYDTSAMGASLTATRAWNLSDDLRTLMLGANTGPEALTWVPDAYLTGAGFFDEASGAPYDPARYPNHAGGLFFVGIEQTGGIYAYALDHTSGAVKRVASIVSGQGSIVALEFDRDTNYLWAWCDDTCSNHATILRVEENPASPRKGRFGVRRSLNRPASLPNLNHEGLTIAPASECSDNKKAVFWVEDGADDHILRRGTVPCGAFLDL